MKFSIIIPHLNEGYLLDAMLDSMYLKIKYSDYEIIIVDDGSDDISHLDFTKNHPLSDKISIFYTEGGLGPAKIKNLGAKYSSGDYLLFLDAHMYFVDDFLEKLDDFLYKNPHIEILQPSVGSTTDKSYINNSINIFDNTLNLITSNKEILHNIELNGAIRGHALIIGNAIFDRALGFNDNFVGWGVEDTELAMRLWLLGYKSYLVSTLKIVHHFKYSFYNYSVKSENVLSNKIMFAYTCFSNLERRFNILNSLREYYGDELYNKVLNDVEQDEQFWDWLDIQKSNFKYSDDWYFEKFEKYYPEFMIK